MNQEKNNQEPEPQRRVEKNEHVLREGIDLSGRLKDSEAKFQDKQEEPAQVFLPGTPKIIQRMIKYSGGVIKNENQAFYIVLGLIVLMIIVSLFLFFGAIRSPSPPPAHQIIDVAGPEEER